MRKEIIYFYLQLLFIFLFIFTSSLRSQDFMSFASINLEPIQLETEHLNTQVEIDTSDDPKVSLKDHQKRREASRLNCIVHINEYIQENLNLNDFVYSSRKIQLRFKIYFNAVGEVETVRILDDANHIRVASRIKFLIAMMSSFDSQLTHLQDDHFLILPIMISDSQIESVLKLEQKYL